MSKESITLIEIAKIKNQLVDEIMKEESSNTNDKIVNKLHQKWKGVELLYSEIEKEILRNEYR